jgi:hypothetical protein
MHPSPKGIALALKESALPPVRIEKPSKAPKRTGREKCCATCDRPFTLQPGEKYFDCPTCYEKKAAAQKNKKYSSTRVLTQICCVQCGATEFVGFVPDDLSNVLCGSCFSEKVREQKIKK